MTRKIIFLLLMLFLGGVLGTLIQQAPGYVMLAYKKLSVEMSLWIFLLLALLFYWAASLIISFMRFLLETPAEIKNWRRNRRIAKAQKDTLEGMQNLLEGNWKAAYRQLSHAAEISKTPMLNFLGAARAAHALGKEEDRNKWLEKAKQKGRKGQVLAALSFAEALIGSNDQQGAMQQLAKAAAIEPRNPQLKNLRALLVSGNQQS